MSEKKPALRKIFSTDYATFLATMFIVIAAGAFLFDRLVEPLTVSQELPYITAFVGVVGIPVIVWRIRLISSTFEYGWEVNGDIVDIGFFRDRGKVSYIYTVQGQRYQASNAMLKNRTTRSLQSGQKVKIVANRDNPKVAFIRDIYT